MSMVLQLAPLCTITTVSSSSRALLEKYPFLRQTIQLGLLKSDNLTFMWTTISPFMESTVYWTQRQQKNALLLFSLKASINLFLITQSKQSQSQHQSLFDHAIKALRRRRFTVAATALTIKWPELLSLTSVTLFAPSDMALFSQPEGFRYDYRHHVVPQQYRFGDLARNAKGSMVFQSLAPNKTLVVNFIYGVLTVNGVIVNTTEVYRNRWIVVLSVSMSLDAAGNLLDSGSFAPSPSPATMDIRYPDERINYFTTGVQSPSPATMEIPYPDEILNGFNAGVHSPSPETMGFRYPDEMINGFNPGVESPGLAAVDIHYPDECFNASIDRVQSPSPATMDIRYLDERINDSTTSVNSPLPATMETNLNELRSAFGIPLGMKGGDLLCLASSPRNRQLQEKEDQIDEHVAPYAPLDVKGQVAEGVNQSMPLISEEHSRTNNIAQNHQDHLNIANDLFFYF